MSQAVKAMYRKKGVRPPEGKGVHKKAFHDQASSIMRDHPEYSRSKAYRIAMGNLGPGRAVKKSHQRRRENPRAYDLSPRR